MSNADEILVEINKLVAANRKNACVLGARAMVLGTFLEAVLPHLTTPQCAAVTRSFRQGIEDAMSLTDDVALPTEYHSVLLELTNTILVAMSEESAARQ
jgi:hypothetical protein